MPSDIQRQLALVRLQCRQPLVVREAEGEVVRAFKQEMKQQKAIVIKALSDVSAFGPLDPHTLESMADATPYRDVPAGGIVAAQDGAPAEFFIVVSGIIRVSRRAVAAAGSASVGEHEVNRLYAGSNFGARALLTGEQYTTTYEAVGPVTLAVMSADDFHTYTDRAIATKFMTSGDKANPREDQATAEKEGGDAQSYREEVVNRVPIFAPLSSEQKRLVSSALLEVHFRPGLYICEEGKPGSSFHIIMTGTSRVTIHDPNAPDHQREVTKLHKDDFFGEVALFESGLRTATVVAETDVTCLSLTRRHFDLYLTPIKAAILEGAAAKEILDMKGDDEDFDDELDDAFDTSAVQGAQTTGPRIQSQVSKGVKKKDERAAGGNQTVTTSVGRATDRNVQAYGENAKRRKRLSSYRGVAAHALRVKRRRRKWFDEGLTGTSAKLPASLAEMQEARRQSISIGQPLGEIESPTSGTNSRGRYLSKLTKSVRALARSMVLSLENDLYAMLLDEMIERPMVLPEFNKIVSEVLHERVRRWDHAYSLIRDAAHSALGKGTKTLRDGELAVLAAMLRLNPVLRKRHCSNWPEYQVAELCKRMRFVEVRSLDKVFVHGAHGTKCYVLLRGFARILCPVEGDNGIVHFRPNGDVRPGDVVGDSVLDGVSHRSSTVVAVTDCEFAAFGDSEFAKIKDQGPSQMSIDEKCQYLRGFNLMRNSTIYHLYKIALLVRLVVVAKDSVILKASEPSKALYFIIAGTVEVIQNVELLDEHEPLLPVALWKTARRVLTMLESGEYFGESGVIAFFKGGNKASSAAANLVNEQFYTVAGTHVELLVLRRKHFNIIDMPMLDILRANNNARLLWRARRKLEAYRGRAVLSAAKKALEQAAVEVGSCEGQNVTAQFPSLPQQRSFNRSEAGLLAGEKRIKPTQRWRAPPHCGSVEQGVGAGLPSCLEAGLGGAEVKGGEGEGSKIGGGAAENLSLAGLTLVSKDSLQYSLDSGRFPILGQGRAIPDGGNMRSLTEDEQSTAEAHQDQCHHDRQTVSGKLPSLEAGAYEPSPGTWQSIASLSLPSLGPSMGAPRPDENDRDGGRMDLKKHVQTMRAAGPTRRRELGRSGDPHGGGCLAYAGHKQSGLHGSKSFGAFWGEMKASGAQQNIDLMSKLPGGGKRLHSETWKCSNARENDATEPNMPRDDPQQKVYRKGKRWGSPGSGGPLAAVNETIKGGDILGCQGQALSRRHTGVVPTISKKRRGKKGAALVPVRGISRVGANAS